MLKDNIFTPSTCLSQIHLPTAVSISAVWCSSTAVGFDKRLFIPGWSGCVRKVIRCETCVAKHANCMISCGDPGKAWLKPLHHHTSGVRLHWHFLSLIQSVLQDVFIPHLIMFEGRIRMCRLALKWTQISFRESVSWWYRLIIGGVELEPWVLLDCDDGLIIEPFPQAWWDISVRLRCAEAKRLDLKHAGRRPSRAAVWHPWPLSHTCTIHCDPKKLKFAF